MDYFLNNFRLAEMKMTHDLRQMVQLFLAVH